MSPLLAALLLHTTPLAGIVDRIEGDWAVVEWCGDAVEDLPLELLSWEVREGEPLWASLAPDPGGTWERDEAWLRRRVGAEEIRLPLSSAPPGLGHGAPRFSVAFQRGSLDPHRCGPAAALPSSRARTARRRLRGR